MMRFIRGFLKINCLPGLDGEVWIVFCILGAPCQGAPKCFSLLCGEHFSVRQEVFVRLEATRGAKQGEKFFIYVFARLRMRAKTWHFLFLPVRVCILWGETVF